MDKADEQSGRMEQIHEQLLSAYSQFPPESHNVCLVDGEGTSGSNRKDESTESRNDLSHPTLVGLPISRLRQVVTAVSMLVSLQSKSSPM